MNITRKIKASSASEDASPNESVHTSRRSTPSNFMDTDLMDLFQSPMPDLNAENELFMQNKRAAIRASEQWMLAKLHQLSAGEMRKMISPCTKSALILR